VPPPQSGVGKKVGAGIGSAEGSGVGIGVGGDVGCGVGSGDGGTVGLAVGARLGSCVGRGVGSGMGSRVGGGLGACEGRGAGTPVGLCVGCPVGRGDTEGAGLGAALKRPSTTQKALAPRPLPDICSSSVQNDASAHRKGSIEAHSKILQHHAHVFKKGNVQFSRWRWRLETPSGLQRCFPRRMRLRGSQKPRSSLLARTPQSAWLRGGRERVH